VRDLAAARPAEFRVKHSERRSDEDCGAGDGAAVGELHGVQAIVDDREPRDTTVDDLHPSQSSAARSLAVTGHVCAKKITSSDHCRSRWACWTAPGPLPSTPIG